MARFRYRMQSILNIKQKLEDQARNDFAQERLRLNEEEEKLESLKSRLEHYYLEGRQMRQSNLHVLELQENKEAIARMEEYISLQELEVRRAQKRLDAARDALQKAMQETKTQERLRENAFEAFMREENAKEAKEVDELTSYTYGAANKANG